MKRFYRYHFIDIHPADIELIPVCRTVGTDTIPNEMVAQWRLYDARRRSESSKRAALHIHDNEDEHSTIPEGGRPHQIHRSYCRRAGRHHGCRQQGLPHAWCHLTESTIRMGPDLARRNQYDRAVPLLSINPTFQSRDVTLAYREARSGR
jgi:hypothetical protein